MILTNYYIKRKICALAKKAPFREHSYRTLEQAKDLLLVYSREDKEIVFSCIEKLHKLQKNVRACVYLPAGHPYDTESDHLQIKEEKDTDLLMLPKSPVFTQFKDIPADILIDLSRPYDYVMHYMVLTHPAMLKVGRKKENFSIHDISILSGTEEGVDSLFEHILFYLQTIRSGQ